MDFNELHAHEWIQTLQPNNRIIHLKENLQSFLNMLQPLSKLHTSSGIIKHIIWCYMSSVLIVNRVLPLGPSPVALHWVQLGWQVGSLGGVFEHSPSLCLLKSSISLKSQVSALKQSDRHLRPEASSSKLLLIKTERTEGRLK